MQFSDFLDISLFPSLRSFSKLQGDSYIINNYSLLHLWWKESLLNYQKVSKYYEHDCLQNVVLLFMSPLKALIVKNSHILIWIYFIFLQITPRPNMRDFNIKFGLNKKIGNAVAGILR